MVAGDQVLSEHEIVCSMFKIRVSIKFLMFYEFCDKYMTHISLPISKHN